MKDLMNLINVKPVIFPAAGPADNTPQVGQIVNHQGFASATYIIATGAITDVDATFAVKLEHGDDPALADAAVCVDGQDTVGTQALAGFTFANDNACRKIGYIGGKQYTRLTITPANNASAAPMAAVCVLGHPSYAPTANPPA